MLRPVLLILALALALPARAAEITPEALDALPQADVILLGEVHDNPAHHLNQARAVAALRPKALVFEMLTPEAAAAAPADRSDATALGRALGWDGSGWPDFALYHPIFAAAPEARLYGAEWPRDQVRRAVTEGAAVVFGPEAARYGLDRPLPAAEQRAREDEQFQAHCGAMPADLMAGMVQAQRLRDAALARAVVQAVEETGGPVVVIAGGGHVRRDWGVPAVLAQAAPGLRLLSVGQLEAAPDAEPATAPATASDPAPPYDLWLITPPEPRDDPCAAFSGG